MEGKKLVQVSGEGQEEGKEEGKEEGEGGGKSVEERLEELERALKDIRGEGKGVVERAKIVAKGVSRQLRNGTDEERIDVGREEVKNKSDEVVSVMVKRK